MKALKSGFFLIGLCLIYLNSNAQCNITPSKYKGCIGDQFQFEIDPSNTYSSIMWSFGDGDSSNQKTNIISHTYSNYGTFTVRVTTYNASGGIKCGPKSVTIRIYDIPNADAEILSPTKQCFKGNYFQFMDKSTPGKSGAPIVFHLWDFGDGDASIQKNPYKEYSKSGIYTIFLQITDTNGCTDTSEKNSWITVLGDLTPKFKTTYKISCPTTPVKFDNLTDSFGNCISKWWWDFGDGSYDSSMTGWNTQITHLYKKDGTFNPVFHVENCYGCEDSYLMPAGARNASYYFDIKKNNSGPVCWDGNNVCFEQKPRPNAIYWLWTFDDPPSMQLNNDDRTWKPCHNYTAPGYYNLTLKIIEPNCTRDTTYCMYIPVKGPMAMIKLPAPAQNSKCQSGKIIPISVFEAAYSKCWNPNSDPLIYAIPQKMSNPNIRVDSFYCNAPVKSHDHIYKPGCTDTLIVKTTYTLAKAQGADKFYDSISWFMGSWFPGDPYPWVADPIKNKNVFYPPVTACNRKNMHDSDQFKFDCRGPNLVFFPNNSQKYRLRYDIDNNPASYTIPPGPDMSMDKCKNPSYPWASDSLSYFWDFGDAYAINCTSTVSVPNINCKYSSEITPYHNYLKSGCYSARLKVTDMAINCQSNTTINIPMVTPDAGWDYTIFKMMALAGFDTSERKLDWTTQLQLPATWGRRGMILEGVPCVGQPYPQRPVFNETEPTCDRQKWWMVFDSAAQCSGYCNDVTWADTNADGTPDKKIVTVAVQCGWIDDQTFAMMGNKWIYGKGGCKTIGLIIKTGDCIDTFWYNEYKYIADLQAGFDILDPASKNSSTGKYQSTLDYATNQHLRLCPPFHAILTVADTQQVGIKSMSFSIGKSYAAPWTNPWTELLEYSSRWIQNESYLLCKDSMYIDPFTLDTVYLNCIVFPSPNSNCGLNKSGNLTIQDFSNRGYFKRATYKLLDLRDTIFMSDSLGRSLYEPGKYTINSVITNIYGCANTFQAEVFVGHYTDFEASDQIVCYRGGKATVVFKGNVRYFQQKLMPWDPELNPTNFWRDPLGPRGGNVPQAPFVTEKIEWDLNGDGIYGDGATGKADSVFYVYTQPGNFNVSMRTTDSNGCVQILERKEFIRVMDVVADFDTAQGVSVCAPQTVKFIDKSYGVNNFQNIYDVYGNVIGSIALDSIISWHWDFGDNLPGNFSHSYLKNPLHTYRENGCYTIKLIVTMSNGCTDTIVKKDIVCIQGPKGEFTVLKTSGYAPFTVFVKDKSEKLKTWEFILGDNTISKFSKRPADSMFSLVYTKPGTYYLYLQATDSVFNSAVGKWIICIHQYGEPFDSMDPHFKIEVYPNSIEEATKSNEFFVYPNPFTESVSVYLPQNKPVSDIEMYDISGKKILFRRNMKGSNLEIMREDLPQGIYILKIVSDKVYVFKLMAE